VCLEGRIEVKILYEDCSKAPQKRAMILTRRVMMETKTLRENTNREETGQNRAEKKSIYSHKKTKVKRVRECARRPM
jgi:hypothetical protein